MAETDCRALAKKDITPDALMVIVLNVGDGDAIIIRFPTKYGKNVCAVVDCYDASKTIAALKILNPEKIAFICATHPHYDHTKGLAKLIKWCLDQGKPVEQFWDSGFRHVSATHYHLIRLLQKHPEIGIIYPTSGYETTINRVQVKVLSPSIQLKNRYDTFGTNINNASIVLKLEYPPQDMAPYYKQELTDEEKRSLSKQEKLQQATAVLAGDAQFDAWARMNQEFPRLVSTSNRGRMIDPKKVKHAPLHCQFLKAPHHMSKHGLTLEVVETLKPQYTVGSCANKSRHKFPAELTAMAVKDACRDKPDGGLRFTGHRDPDKRAGTVVGIFREGSNSPRVHCLGEAANKDAPLP